MNLAKYEIYLPIKYNDGSDVEPEKFKQIDVLITVQDIRTL